MTYHYPTYVDMYIVNIYGACNDSVARLTSVLCPTQINRINIEHILSPFRFSSYGISTVNNATGFVSFINVKQVSFIIQQSQKI